MFRKANFYTIEKVIDFIGKIQIEQPEIYKDIIAHCADSMHCLNRASQSLLVKHELLQANEKSLEDWKRKLILTVNNHYNPLQQHRSVNLSI